MYNEIVMDHFSDPRNLGEIADADAIGHMKNAADGDQITIYIKVKDNKIHDIKFKTLGCGAAIAASSMLTVLAKGKTIDEATNITNDDVNNALGGLPEQKLKCSNNAATALHNAISKYKETNYH
ncbi:MAG: iron-sulfur cluster assembly scaffold protein [Sedimentibacter sp.]